MSNVATQDLVQKLNLTEGEIKFYNEEGYLLIPGLLSTETANVLAGEVRDIMDAIGISVDKLQQTHQYLEGSNLDSFVNSANLRDVASQLMGGASTLYLPFTAVKNSGGGRFHFHQDNQYTYFDGPGINLWTALTDMTPENGCLQLIPRSHLNGTLGAKNSGDGDGHKKIEWEPSDFLPVRMRAGDTIAFTRLTIHGSGPNQTDDLRIAYANQFHRNDVNWRQPDGSFRNLVELPRYTDITPVRELSVPTGKRDGH